ncbi:glycosyl hydrolase family 76-domain-containing protein [Obelidium mucronatum]|nr:glycosyl hydrolase family 76-domain-containing protein [Obelidium mucronatum]
MKLSFLLTLVVAAAAQQTIDVTSKTAAISAAKAAMGPLQQFYAGNTRGNGAWIEQYDDGHWLIQWHETGLYFDLFYKYMQYSSDYSRLPFVDKEMQITVGSNGDFLDGMNPTVEIAGRWNDDIGWWALATMTAAETFGKDGIIARNNLLTGYNPTYLSVTNTTFHQIWMDWDTKTCGGGIYWSRIRTGSNADLKSTITNVQELELGARLFALTGNADYKAKFDIIYAWLKSTGIIDSNYLVHDGVRDGGCTVSKEIYSYHTGELMAALAVMYQATKTQTYLDEAHKVFAAVRTYFVTASTNVLDIEPSCAAGVNCKSPTGYYWAIYKGFANLYVATTDNAIKSSIAKIVQSSALVNFKGCDSNWYCIRNLPVGTGFTMQNGTNPRDQFETVAILNTLAIINGAPPTLAVPGGGSAQSTPTSSKSAAFSIVSALGSLAATAAGWFFI